MKNFAKTYVLNIGYSCNNRCLFCYNFGGQSIRPKLNLKLIKEEIKKAKQLNYQSIALFGGEPILHNNFFEILDFIQKEKLAIRMEKDFNNKLSLENIVLTTGVRHSLFLVFLLLIKPGDEVILQKPCWEGYEYGINNVDGVVKKVKKNINIKEIKKKINKKTKAILITNPYLFDFSTLPLSKIKSLVNLCREYNIYFIIDEIVNYYLERPISVLENYNVEKDPLIIVNSFSKNYFMPFYRSGYLIANKRIIENAKKIIKISNFNITSKSLSISYAALLDKPKKWCSQLRKKSYEKGRY